MRQGFIYAGILCLVLVLALFASADTGERLLGDESTGSLSAHVHLMQLYDEEGTAIAADDELPQPFSPRQTCGKCHSYRTISGGWHFNAADANVAPGRPGQPWIFVDPRTRTQIPLSFRPWPGTYRPDDVGLSPWEFIKIFATHMPGGGVGEFDSDNPPEIMRQFVSGKLEINCLSCHNAHFGQDQGGIFGWATQIGNQSFRWAAAAACEFASVKGSAASQGDTYDPLMDDKIATTYREGTFDNTNRVLSNIVRKVLDERCYYCHSSMNADKHGLEKWPADEDVHLTAGMTCVDCHRNGLEHNIIRGYEGENLTSKNPLAAATTCQGCHNSGRLGAPVPTHPGIPPIHFEKLTCTACHSGPWPSAKTYRGKTSLAHALGTHGVKKSKEALPHIMYPVFAKQQSPDDANKAEHDSHDNGRIAPHKLVWPAFWATLKDEKVAPIALDVVRKKAGKFLSRPRPPVSGDWAPLSEENITRALAALASDESVEGAPVYVCGGKMYRLDDSGKLGAEDHPAAKAYVWPFAHNVRPAAQSLGVHKCEDCHSTKEGFFFGAVAVDSPLESDANSVVRMVRFAGVRPFYTKAFAFSFVFRPWLKVVALGSCALLAGIILLFALRALACVAKVLTGRDS